MVPLAFVALVPLTLHLAQLPPGFRGRWAATRGGFAFGLVFWGTALIWIPLVVGPSFSWALPGYALLLALLGGLSGAFGWTFHHLHRDRGVPVALALPLAWVAFEWVKAHFPMDLSFPWLGLAVTLTGWPELLGVGEWIGEEGVAFWLAGANGLLAGAILGSREDRGALPWFFFILACVLPGALGLLRNRTLPLSEGPRIAVVGTQVPRQLAGQPGESIQAGLLQVSEALESLSPGSVDLVLLPEATLPVPIGEPLARGPLDTLRAWSRRLESPVAFGALGRPASSGGEGMVTNSAFLVLPEVDSIQRYDKEQLVPAMEGGKYWRGRESQVFRLGKWVAGPLICYESLFAGLARDRRRGGARVLLNLSSDVWFGGNSTPVGSLFLDQHPSHLILRAVETRMAVARSANGGTSLLLDPRGRLVGEPLPPGSGLLVGRPPVFNGKSLFTRSGPWVGLASLLGCTFLILGFRFRALPRPPGNGEGPAPRSRTLSDETV
jgi:apolipoprotein N-acyltransferase